MNASPVVSLPPKSHVAFFYETLEERMQLLAEYFKEGLARNEQCIFATPGSIEHAVDSLCDAGLDVRDTVDKGALRIFEMYQTYLPDGKFVSDHMLANVTSFIEDAKSQGFSGLRTAGEMRWINVYPDLLPDATQYESDITHLCDQDHNFTGLCLYPIVPDATAILKAALQTHPVFIHKGKLNTNPYIGPEKNSTIATVRDVAMLTSLLVSDQIE